MVGDRNPPVKVGDVLGALVGRIEAVVNVSLRGGNPGDAAVGCMIGGKVVARRVGHMSNCRASWFAIELAIDMAEGKPMNVITCFSEKPPKSMDHRDADVFSRITRKSHNSHDVLRIRKHEDDRFDVVLNHVRQCLNGNGPVWIPSSDYTRESVQGVIEDRANAKTESPAEVSLLSAMRRHFPHPAIAYPNAGRPWEGVPAFQGELGKLIPQMKVGKYRGDFAVINDNARLFVEVDGYAFHDSTRDQLEHDRQRDRFLMAQGWRVARFTGREVWKDADRCADDVATILRSLG